MEMHGCQRSRWQDYLVCVSQRMLQRLRAIRGGDLLDVQLPRVQHQLLRLLRDRLGGNLNTKAI